MKCGKKTTNKEIGCYYKNSTWSNLLKIKVPLKKDFAAQYSLIMIWKSTFIKQFID